MYVEMNVLLFLGVSDPWPPCEKCSKSPVIPLYWLVENKIPSSWMMLVPNQILDSTTV